MQIEGQGKEFGERKNAKQGGKVKDCIKLEKWESKEEDKDENELQGRRKINGKSKLKKYEKREEEGRYKNKKA